MEHIPTDTKLQLVQMIRNENQANQMRMRSREQILYQDYPSGRSETGPIPYLGLRLRIAFSFLAFLAFLIMDYTGFSSGGFDSKKVIAMVNESVDINSFDFIKALPYTLSETGKTENK